MKQNENKINAMYAINYAYEKMKAMGMNPLTLEEKINHGKNCACKRCSAYTKLVNEYVEKTKSNTLKIKQKSNDYEMSI